MSYTLSIRFYKLVSMYMLLLFLVGCKENEAKIENDVREFLTAWNERHTAIASMNLKHDYMDEVVYYAADFTKEQVQQHKNGLFELFPDYKQIINDSSVVIERDGADYIVSFTRTLSLANTNVTVPTFLNLSAKNRKLRILREGIQKGSAISDFEAILPKKISLEKGFRELRKLYGDFNGDGLSDYAWVAPPSTVGVAEKNVAINCPEGCERTVRFSNNTSEPWVLDSIYTASLENLSDLNGDGADEIGLWNKKSDTETLYVWDASANLLLTEPLVINTKVHKNLKLIDVIKKTGPKKITVTSSVQENGVWKLKSRIVELQ